MSDPTNSVAVKLEAWQIAQRQSLPMEAKVIHSRAKIREWYEHWGGLVYVSFSGGKDSTVLLHMAREELGMSIPAVFLDTGVEYPEVRDFALSQPGVTRIKPAMSFPDTLIKYGYPIVSKEVSDQVYYYRHSPNETWRASRLTPNAKGYLHIPYKWQFLLDAPFPVSANCCDSLKKHPAMKYERQSHRHPMTGMMAADSSLRKMSLIKAGGCSVFSGNRPRAAPLAYWCEEDIWAYLHTRGLTYASLYDHGYTRTGCYACAFGCSRSGLNNYQRLAVSHPKLWRYCLDDLGFRAVLDYVGVRYDPI